MGTITFDPDDLAATRTALGLTIGTDVLAPSGSAANLTNLPASGGTIDLTASGAITAGKTLILNSDGTVSQVGNNAITQVIGSAYTPSSETASDRGVMDSIRLLTNSCLLQKAPTHRQTYHAPLFLLWIAQWLLRRL